MDIKSAQFLGGKMSTAVELIDIKKQFDGQDVLKDINLKIEENEFNY